MSEAQVEPSDSSLTLAVRYTAANAEVCARLQSRQTTNSVFATVTVSAVTATLGAALANGFLNQWALLGAGGTVALSWAFSLWIVHNDSIIGLLSRYCKELEKQADNGGTGSRPAWHTDSQMWIQKARGFRKLSDWASMILAAMAAAPAIVSGIVALNSSQPLVGLGGVIVGVIGLGAVRLLFDNSARRKNIAAMEFDNTGGLLNLHDPAPTGAGALEA